MKYERKMKETLIVIAIALFALAAKAETPKRCPAVMTPGIILRLALPEALDFNPERELKVTFRHKDGRQASVLWRGDSYSTVQEQGLFLVDAINFPAILPEKGMVVIQGPVEAGDFEVQINMTDLRSVSLPNIHVNKNECFPIAEKIDVALQAD